MKFEFTAEHVVLQNVLADLTAREADARKVYNTDAVIDTALWTAVRDAGLLGVGAPEAYEGGGGGPVEQVFIAEALGRVVGAIPFSEHTAAAQTIAAFGTEDQCKRFLIPLVRGDSIAGITLPRPTNVAAVEAKPDGSGWRLEGRLPLVPNAAAATVLAVPARSDGEVRWFVTETADISALPTVDRTRPGATVEFSGAEAVLLSGSPAGPRPEDLLLTLAAAEAAGAASTALDSTARYATERQQFGLPIGTFQAVKHRLADMLVAVENSRSAVYGAAWALAEGGRVPRSVALAQAVATGNAVVVISDAVQLHGGIGVTWECDLHLFLRRAKALEVTYGSPAQHRSDIAAALLDD